MADGVVPTREIVIKVSVGDILHLAECAVWAAQMRSWDAFRRCLWVMRETRRRGAWAPYTVGDMVVLRRRRRGVRKPPWRHGPLLNERTAS